LIVQTATPDSPDSVSSSFCGSHSLPSLGSGTTFATSILSENEEGRELDEMARIPYSEDLAICQSLKRSREEFEHLQDAGETQRQRPADYLGQRHDQPIPRGIWTNPWPTSNLWTIRPGLFTTVSMVGFRNKSTFFVESLLCISMKRKSWVHDDGIA
jgi:hypothetical protein